MMAVTAWAVDPVMDCRSSGAALAAGAVETVVFVPATAAAAAAAVEAAAAAAVEAEREQKN